MPVLMYSMSHDWKEKERSSMIAVQKDNLRGLDKVPNARIRELCRVTKGEDERIDEGVLQWFGHVERMENDRIAKRVYVGEGKLRKKWTNIMKNCLKKKGLDVKQTRK